MTTDISNLRDEEESGRRLPDAEIGAQLMTKRKPGRPKKAVQEDDHQVPATKDKRNLRDVEEPEPAIRRLPERKRFAPRRLGVLQALFLMRFFSIIFAESPTTSGIHFQKKSGAIFSNSEWIVITEVTFTDILRSMRDFRADLENRSWNQSITIQYEDSEKKKQHEELHKSPTYLQHLVKAYAQKLTKNALTTLDTIRRRLNLLVDSVQIDEPLSKKRRGIVNAGGDVLKWLFGTPNNRDLKGINQRLKTLAKSNSEIIHSVEDQATIFAEGLLQTKVNTKILEGVRETLSSLDEDLFNIKTEILGATLNFAEALLNVNLAFNDIQTHLDSLEQYVDDLNIAFATLALERLPPQLFSPKKLLTVLESVSKQIPRRWALAIDAHPGNLWMFYQEAIVKTAIFSDSRQRPKGLKLFLHIPIYEVKFEFILYEVLNLPVYSRNTTLGVQYKNLPDYLAVSNDREQFTTLRKDEVDSCVKTTELWICSNPRIFHKIHTTQSCVMSLFTEDKNQKHCIQMLVVWKGPYSNYLGNRKRLISDQEDRDVSFTCADPNKPRIAVMKIHKLVTLEIPLGCSAHTNIWIIPADSKRTITPTSLEISFANNGLFQLNQNSFLNLSRASIVRDTKRQQLLKDIAEQLKTVEQDTNELHDLNGMSIKRLKSLSERLDREMSTGYEMSADMTVVTTISAVLLIVLVAAIFLGMKKYLAVTKQLQLLEDRLRHHEVMEEPKETLGDYTT